MKKNTLVRWALSAAVLLVFMLHVGGLVRFRLLDTIENFSYDARVLATLPGTSDPRIVIVDLDEKTVAAEGWPWRRDKWARMIDQVFGVYHAKAAGFDIDFDAPDDRAQRSFDDLMHTELANVPGLAERAAELREKLDYDRVFAAALKGKPVVLGMFFKRRIEKGESAGIGGLCQPLLDKTAVGLYAVDFIQQQGYAGNQPVLTEAAPQCGFFDNESQDDDGVLRRVPLMQMYDGAVYPSLALELVRLVQGNPAVELVFDPPDVRTSLHLEEVRVGEARAPVDGQVAVYVPYRGGYHTFQYVPATDVLNGKLEHPEVLKDAVVLFGASAAGLLDLRTTPTSKGYAGVEVHANIVSGLLNGSIRQKAPYYNGIETVFLFLIAGMLAWGFIRLSPAGSATLGLGIIAGIAALAFALWSGAHFIMPMGMPIAFTLSVMMVHLFYGFFIESRGKREISKLFGQYVPPELVEEMAATPEAISMEGESRDMTVLFSDVRNFTSISEKLDAKELAAMMNAYLSKQTGVVQKHRGTIDKYIGDAIMAFWGAPLADKDHALNAVTSAMQMVSAVRELDADFEKRGWPKLSIGVGVNSGKMNVGNMGSSFRMAYTVMGDAVNLGARLEGLTKKYGVSLLISDDTRNALPSDWAFREVDFVRVKGKNEPVGIYEPMGPKEQLDPGVRQDLARLRGVMQLYRAQKWDQAEQEFFNLMQGERPLPLYEKYIERIMHWRENPPPKGWDGTWNWEEK
ncbi:MAG TPA: adenylate/guanylate cyclase domain-containing protein [Nevskiaceae bacterium]|nr:adenylate/guanylate cyclase domain-containing protein [Nevskiaceae bacterium]